MPRVLLVLVALLLVPSHWSAACACAASACPDDHPSHPARTSADEHDDREHDDGGSGHEHAPGHRHHAPDCPAAAAIDLPVANPAPVETDLPATPPAAGFVPTPERSVPVGTAVGPAGPPAVPLHVRLQVFRI